MLYTVTSVMFVIQNTYVMVCILNYFLVPQKRTFVKSIGCDKSLPKFILLIVFMLYK